MDDEPPEGGEPPWEEPPTGETPPWEEEQTEPSRRGMPLWARRRFRAERGSDAEAGAREDEDAPGMLEPPEPEPEPGAPAGHGHDDEPLAYAGDPDGEDGDPALPPLGGQDELPGVTAPAPPLYGGEEPPPLREDGEHPTSEQPSLADGEEPATDAGEPRAGALPDPDEPPWGSGPPPWERGGFWGEDAEEESPAAGAEGAPLAAEDLTTRRARQRVEHRRAGHRRLAGVIGGLVVLIVIIVVLTSGGGGIKPPANTTTAGSRFAHAGKGKGYLAVKLDTSVLGENILVADRNNSRLLALSPLGQPVYSLTQSAPSDAYLSSTGHTVFVTEHSQSVVVVRRVDSGRISYIYGRSGVRSAAENRLHDPQTAQETAGGQLVIADRGNCRIVFVDPNSSSHKTKAVWGSPGHCTHHVNPTVTGDTFAFPVAAFAASNGDVVVTEQHPAWVDILTRDGSLVSAVELSDFASPSDANEYAPNHVIVVDHTRPGKIAEFDFSSSNATLTPSWQYAPSSGAGELNKPTLAVVLENGDVLVADAGNDRVIVIDPKLDHGAGKIVWQYGHKARPGSRPGFLHTPDSVTLVPNTAAR